MVRLQFSRLIDILLMNSNCHMVLRVLQYTYQPQINQFSLSSYKLKNILNLICKKLLAQNKPCNLVECKAPFFYCQFSAYNSIQLVN